jgi:hypothetical protein
MEQIMQINSDFQSMKSINNNNNIYIKGGPTMNRVAKQIMWPCKGVLIKQRLVTLIRAQKENHGRFVQKIKKKN